tara:strand:+ start:523 stop:828 length:306 start_codon:yes stop_codon:yes gene_type:complete
METVVVAAERVPLEEMVLTKILPGRAGQESHRQLQRHLLLEQEEVAVVDGHLMQEEQGAAVVVVLEARALERMHHQPIQVVVEVAVVDRHLILEEMVLLVL